MFSIGKEYKEALIVGDIHGMYDEMEALLKNWKPDVQQLIFVGDFIDRGYDSLSVLEKIWQLQQDYQVICIRGNHESMLYHFIKSPINYFNHYILNGGVSTLIQLLELEEEDISKSSCRKIVRQLKNKYPGLEDWLENLPLYYEFGEFIIAHAGIDLTLDNWQDTSDHDFMWIRDRFHSEENLTGKQIIFGHTPTMVLNQDYYNSSVWRKNFKWGIDGGIVFGGQLHGLRVSRSAVIDIHSVEIIEGVVDGTSRITRGNFISN